MDAAGISAWLFGGWGLDARIGRITREHGDVEFWVERIHAERSKAVLVEAGARRTSTISRYSGAGKPPLKQPCISFRPADFTRAIHAYDLLIAYGALWV